MLKRRKPFFVFGKESDCYALHFRGLTPVSITTCYEGIEVTPSDLRNAHEKPLNSRDEGHTQQGKPLGGWIVSGICILRKTAGLGKQRILWKIHVAQALRVEVIHRD
jgi:hypothetical protein